MTVHRTLLARRLGSNTFHVVVGVSNWYSGMTATSECGVRMCEVLDRVAGRNDPQVCKRCRKTLGWSLDTPTDKPVKTQVTVRIPEPVNARSDNRHLNILSGVLEDLGYSHAEQARVLEAFTTALAES